MESSNSYLVKWQPADKPGERQLHFLRLTSSAPDIRLRYLHSYVDDLGKMSRQERLNAAERALETPLAAGEIIIRVQLHRTEENAREGVAVTFAPDHIQLSKMNGSYTGLVDVVYAYFDGTGQRIKAGQRNEVRLNIQEDKLKSFLNEDHKIEDVLTVPERAAKLRVVVRDANSGALGSATIPLH